MDFRDTEACSANMQLEPSYDIQMKLRTKKAE